MLPTAKVALKQMGKNPQDQDNGISIENNHPGCLWGMLHGLQHHRWHHVKKKMLLRRRHRGGRYSIGVGSPGNNRNATNGGEMQQKTDGEFNNPLIEKKTTEPVQIAKSSMKSQIKALIAEEMSKRRADILDLDPLAEVASNDASAGIICQDNKICSDASTLNPLQSKACEGPVTSNKKCEFYAAMLVTSYMGHSQIGENGKQPVDSDTLLRNKLNKAKQCLLAQKLKNAKEADKYVAFHESNQILDALDISNIYKELFLKVLQDPSSMLTQHGRREFNSKIGFTKSKSFPLAGLPVRKCVGPSKLKQDQDTEYCAKEEEKIQMGSQIQKWAELESTRDISDTPMQLMAECRTNNGPKVDMGRPNHLESSSTGTLPVLKSRQEFGMFIKHFKIFKQKIKQAIRESTKEKNRIATDGLLHKIPYGHKFSKDTREKIDDSCEATTMDKYSKSSSRSSCGSDSMGGQEYIKRMSFNKSLDRYHRLYESSLHTKAKHHVSERSKLRTEEKHSFSGTSKTPERILSSPNLRSYYHLQNEDSLNNTSSDMPIETDVYGYVSRVGEGFDEMKMSGSENGTLLGAHVEAGGQSSSVELGELNHVLKDEMGSRSFTFKEANDKVGFTSNGLGSLRAGESDALHGNKIQGILSLVSKLGELSPISVLDSSRVDMTSPTKFFSEDSRLKPRSLFPDESVSLDSLANQQQEVGMDSPILAESAVIHPKKGSSIELLSSKFSRTLIDTKDAAEFNYVKYVLEMSGFSRNESLGTWHSPDQPVDPSTFERAEGFLFLKPDCYETEEVTNCNHLLLFDLINEVLLEIHKRSFSYCPTILSSNSHIHPVPAGYHVLEEVWANISWYLSWRPELDRSLDDPVSRDLAKGDGWMNLQYEAECVGLELEDMIFDDFLEELVLTSASCD